MDGNAPERTYFVKAEWDAEANVWFVAQTDIPGLSVEADTPASMLDLLESVIPDLFELNGVSGSAIPYSVIFDHLTTARAVA